ncbi:hypothetical protein CYR40_02780 [Chimaeribacter arupi]|uniref:hypothetical protein n=1 Tax=Chimaeribacter arupi TaxID=2060066 RepID=UPI000C7B187A|nr:hypothetical protein [Chimaeribacter arupi]PLR50017.1 hypothetical protein CYR40_02780 [Chimaeribacter arupi]PLR50523.1 hypothetical protein CYR52_10665 [Chimaeribacter arupi]
MFWKVMNRMDGTKIFINEENNGWYVHGIPGMGGSVTSSASFLLSMLESLKAEEVILVGPSMGAYAAMLYGTILKPRMPAVKFRCLSFGGEFLLYIRETRSKNLSKKPKNLWYADLRSLIASSELEITHVYGDNDINDIFQASLVHGLENVNLISLSNAPHAVSTFLGKKFDLTKLIKNYETTGSFDVDCASDISKSSSHGSYLYHGHLMMLDNKPAEAVSNLEKAVKIFPNHALTRHKLGLALLMIKKESEALEQQEIAVSLNPDLAHAHFHIAILSAVTGNNDKALHHYKESVRADDKHTRALLALSHHYLKSGDKSLAEDYAKKVISYDKNNKDASSIIDKLQIMLS